MFSSGNVKAPFSFFYCHFYRQIPTFKQAGMVDTNITNRREWQSVGSQYFTGTAVFYFCDEL